MRPTSVVASERTFEDELALAMLRAARLRATVAVPRAEHDARARTAPEGTGEADAGGRDGDVTDSYRLGGRY
jgi:hypothetical protein